MPFLLRIGLLWSMRDSPWLKLFCKKLTHRSAAQILHLRSTQASQDCHLQSEKLIETPESQLLWFAPPTRRLDSKTIVLRPGQTLLHLKTKISCPRWQFTIQNISAQTLESKLEAHDSTDLFMARLLLGSHAQGSHRNRDKKKKVKRGMYSWVLELKGVSSHQAELPKCNYNIQNYPGVANIEFLLEAHDRTIFFCFFGLGFHKPIRTKVMKITHRQMQAWRSGPMMTTTE